MLRRLLESSQYLSIRYTERLSDVGITPSVGSVGDSYDNALAETVIGLFKTEVIRPQGPWKKCRGSRVRDIDLGRLVQQPAPARTHRRQTTRGERERVLSATGKVSQGGLTQTKEPPVNPGRFRVEKLVLSCLKKFVISSQRVATNSAVS